MSEAKELDMDVESVEYLGQSYAKTLNHWWNNFLAKKEQVLQLGFDERFCRKWLYYLVSCVVAFLAKIIDDVQVLMRKRVSG